MMAGKSLPDCSRIARCAHRRNQTQLLGHLVKFYVGPRQKRDLHCLSNCSLSYLQPMKDHHQYRLRRIQIGSLIAIV